MQSAVFRLNIDRLVVSLKKRKIKWNNQMIVIDGMLLSKWTADNRQREWIRTNGRTILRTLPAWLPASTFLTMSSLCHNDNAQQLATVHLRKPIPMAKLCQLGVHWVCLCLFGNPCTYHLSCNARQCLALLCARPSIDGALIIECLLNWHQIFNCRRRLVGRQVSALFTTFWL